MSKETEMNSIINEADNMNKCPAIIEKLSKEGFTPDPESRPKRCRAIIFNPDGTKVLGIKRKRPDREEYVVYPGGGVEEYDATAMDTVRRELSEELGIDPNQTPLTGTVIELNSEYFYIGIAKEEFKNLVVGGPEATHDVAVSGTYEPGWFYVHELADINFQPHEINTLILKSVNHG